MNDIINLGVVGVALAQFVIMWVVGALATGSILMWWFRTLLPVHLLEALRFLGWKKRDDKFWSTTMQAGSMTLEVPLQDFTTVDFNSWIGSKCGPKVAELLGCPGCLSFHVAFWLAVFLQIVTFTFSPLLFLACLLTWPVVGNLLLQKLKA